MIQDRRKSFEERKSFEDYQKQNPKKDWNFPFKYAFEKIFGEVK